MLFYFGRSVISRRRLRALRDRPGEWLRFWRSYHTYVSILFAHGEVPANINDELLKTLYPCVQDAISKTPIEPIYFYQDAWAFEKIVNNRPNWHVDVGSHHKFVALLSKVLAVTMVDIRPLALPLATLDFRHGSILELPYQDASVPSLSSLCVVEHIGLGRYGDPLDPLGTEKAIAELKRVIAPGGDLYVSIPLNDENRTYFNAHRAFTERYLLSLFSPFDLVETRYIYGNDFGEHARRGFGTGCFWLRRPLD